MRLKDLFTVPEGQKVTEKHLRRVLICSICSILLCMTCLISETWAWYTVTLDNPGNEIWIGTAEVKTQIGGQEVSSPCTLTGESVALAITHGNQKDDLQYRCDLYVTLTLTGNGQTTTLCAALNAQNDYTKTVTLNGFNGYTLSWTTSWFAPNNCQDLTQSAYTNPNNG